MSTLTVSGSNAAGGYLISPEYQKNVYESVHANSVFLNLATVFNSDKRTTYIPKILSGLDDFEYLAEGDAKPEGSITFDQSTMTLKKMALIVPFSDESIREADVGLLGLLKRELAKSLTTKIDHDLFQGVADTSADSFDGLLTQSGFQTTAYGSDIGEDILTAITQIRNENFEPNCICMHSSVLGSLLKIRSSTEDVLKYPSVNSPSPTLWGKPIIISNNIDTTSVTDGTQSDVVVADFSTILVQRGALELKMTNSATLTTAGNLFEKDLSAIRCVQFLSAPLMTRPNAVSIVQDCIA